MPLSVDYALTTTLRLQHKSTDDQLHLSRLPLVQLLEYHGFKHTTVFELTKNCDVHYHSIIHMDKHELPRDIPIYVKNIFRKSKYFGFVCIKQVTGYYEWIKYIIKDIQKTFDRTGVVPIVHDDYNLFPDTTQFDLFARQFQIDMHAEQGCPQGTKSEATKSTERTEASCRFI